MNLSFGQERLWFTHQLDATGHAQNVPVAVRVRGELDVAALAAAWAEVVARHEVLRTVVHAEHGDPRPVLLDTAEVAAVRIGDPARAEEELRAEAEHRFDLAAGPLVRVTVWRLGERDHLIGVVLHHLVCDAHSLSLLFDDWARAYRGEELPPSDTGYADFAARQRKDDAFAEQLEYWAANLADSPADTGLRPDRRRTGAPSFRGAQHRFTVPGKAAGRVKDLARAHRCTPFIVLLAAFQATLGARTGADDVVAGTPMAARSDPDFERVAGYFLNTLPIRVSLAGDPDFATLLGRVREACFGAYRHQDVPFEKLVDRLRPDRALGANPFFRAMLVVRGEDAELALPGAETEVSFVPNGTAKLDLTLYLSEKDGELAGELEYDTDLYDEATVRAFAAHFGRLLDTVTAHPDGRLSAVPVLDAAEARQVLDWGTGERTDPGAATLVERFAEAVRRQPDAIAVVSGEKRLTYAELDRRADRVASVLSARASGSVVAVALPRSPELMASLWGVLKAGLAYLPVDPELPAERIAAMLADAGAETGLTLAKLRDGLPGDGWLAADDLPEDAAAAGGRRDRALYVMFTSGSTGRPKGVVVEEPGVVNRLDWMQRAFELTAGDVVLQKTPIGFDVSVWELFWPLITGARLVLAEPGGHRDPRYLAGLIRAEGVSVLHFVPSMLSAFAEEPSAAGCTSVRDIVCSGEVLPGALRDRVAEVLPDARLHNLYGPTEASVDVTWWPCDREREPDVPIGFAAPNTLLYVTDAGGRLLPPGVDGELWIGGVQVARGYAGRPDLTAERFAPDPFGPPGSRMYRTGDRCRWRADGSLAYTGRGDRQVKIRGLRVEPGEIEAVLRAHPSVRQAVVLARDDGQGSLRLDAYVVPSAPAGLREFARSRLPEQLVPATWTPVETVPVTANGKLDVSALPGPRPPEPAAATGAATPLQETLCGIFAGVLGVPEVGVHDDFFALGGHSLLATKLVSRIRPVLGADVPIRALFEAPTVAALAPRIAEHRTEETGLTARPRPGRVPLSSAQRRLWFLHHASGPSAAYHMPLAFRLRGELDTGALEQALADLAERHESLRTVFPDTDGEPEQLVLPGARPRLRTAEVGPADLTAALETAAREGFDLATEPPLRAYLFTTAPGEHALLLSLHHIAGDGWSLAPLSRDLATAYRARLDGRASDWEPLPVQYADYTLWQTERLERDASAEAEIAYWRERLAGAPEQLTLPMARPRPERASQRGQTVEFAWDAELHAALARVARQHRCTMFMVLHAGLAALLTRLGAGTDVPLGSPIAGRTDEVLDELIGFFVNTLVLRTDTAGDPTFAELLDRVRETDLAAYEHQRVPFERLVEELNPVRSTGHHPLFQIMFVLQNAGSPELSLSDADSEPIAVATGTSRFDLVVSLTERPGEGGIEGDIEFSTDLFDDEDIDLLIRRWRRLLSALAADPAQRIGAPDVLSEEERHRLLVEFNDVGREATTASVAELFEERAAASPEATALIQDDASMTFAGLERTANRFARHLIGQGVGTEEVVALLLPRSFALVAGILGVLKAGAVYLPIDPEYPADRVRYMIADSKPRLVLTAPGLEHLVPEGAPRLVVTGTETLDALSAADTAPTDADRVRPALPGNPAYVIYTSGSTGRPKGVVMPTSGIVNVLDWHRATLRGGPGWRTAQFTAISFDFSVQETLVTLLMGKALAIPGERVRRDPDELVRWIDRHRVNELFAPRLAIEAMIEAATAQGSGLDSLTDVLQGGEAFMVTDAIREFFLARPDRRAYNFYGPTETHAATAHLLDPAPGSWPHRVPIGRGLGNMRMYVLDTGLQLTPPGVPGELFIAGPQVARGYFGRPALTGDRFVPDPFGPPGSRMYRSGDLVRWSADGFLEYLDRIDDQVKIRGFRVELGEIQAALTSHPDVGEAAVTVHTDEGGTRLAGFVVPRNGTADLPAVRAFLGERLPEYMVPAVLTEVPSLPRTPSGKLDRRALPVPDRARPGGDSGYVAPADRLERTVSEVWGDLLGIERVGVRDNFFDLGGHSVVLLKLQSRLSAATGVRLGVVDLFRHTTVAAQARAIAAAGQEAEPADSGRTAADLGARAAAGRARLARRRSRA
ncbi:non-ribosomal peptide synthetase [Amycolatopsis dendrobii]|uniref:Amino acid adenylation domain-containing protein n=1 Tax=Amycolatopsis dendrobii TaxID=2760662 RepID=A0A7W3W3X2_9PSEU|nr:non-ribosomal peptide synthetase [Amycolatopsis dendrobii]MBB1158406.1 amino acid adenylation domain-containing protein [Amycolatopsis dendrobii]